MNIFKAVLNINWGKWEKDNIFDIIAQFVEEKLFEEKSISKINFERMNKHRKPICSVLAS